jgi:voltage-gated potassium channel
MAIKQTKPGNAMLDRLKRMVEQNDTHAGRAFDFVIQALILVSLITFSIETLPNLSPAAQRWLNRIEVAIVVVFTLEYLLRLALADRKLRFAFSFFGLIDLLAILPFYVATGVDLRSIRVFRFLRLFRALKIVRYSKAIRRFHRAFIIAREELVLFVVVTLMLLYFSAVGIYYFENEAQPEKFASVFHSLWWSVATLTTVGYGDIYPVTVGGKIFTFGVLLIGLGIVSVPAGLVASALSKARAMEDAGEEVAKR